MDDRCHLASRLSQRGPSPQIRHEQTDFYPMHSAQYNSPAEEVYFPLWQYLDQRTGVR